MLNVPAGAALRAFAVFVFCAIRYLLEIGKARQGVRVGNKVRQRTSKNLEHHPIWLLYCFYFDFSVAFVAGEGNSSVNKGVLKDLPGNGVGNWIATGSATRSVFQNGSSICRASSSVSSRKPSGRFEPVADSSLPDSVRSHPRCLPSFAKIRGLENDVHPSMLLFIISLISRISHCFGSIA